MKIRGIPVGTTMNPDKIAERIGGDVLASHIEDKNNPHQVTPEQIGAVKPEDVTKIQIITWEEDD